MKTLIIPTDQSTRDRFQGAYWSYLMGVDANRVRAFIAALKSRPSSGSVQ